MIKKLVSAVLALSLFSCGQLAPAQIAPGTKVRAPAGYLPGEVIYCDDGTGTVVSCTRGSATATTGNVAVATSSTLVLGANPLRVGCAMVADTTTNVLIKLGTGASATSFTFEMQGAAALPHAVFSCPPDYQGDVSMIGIAATGTIRWTEW